MLPRATGSHFTLTRVDFAVILHMGRARSVCTRTTQPGFEYIAQAGPDVTDNQELSPNRANRVPQRNEDTEIYTHSNSPLARSGGYSTPDDTTFGSELARLLDRKPSAGRGARPTPGR